MTIDPRPSADPRRETRVERLVREAQERGEFDDLPGRGKPLPGVDGPYDELWWVKRVVQREQLSFLPPALLLRREAEDLLRSLHEMPSEAAVRRAVADYRERAREAVRLPQEGRYVVPPRLDPDEVVALWRERRGGRGCEREGAPGGGPGGGSGGGPASGPVGGSGPEPERRPAREPGGGAPTLDRAAEAASTDDAPVDHHWRRRWLRWPR